VVTPLFRFRPRDGADGGFEATGNIPDVVGTLANRGESLEQTLFDAGADR
jgi:hypothetical protein